MGNLARHYFTGSVVLKDGGNCLTVTPDVAWKANNDLRVIGDALVRISRSLHEHTHKLEVAVEGTYAGESADPRVRLLSDALHISRIADLELGRLNQSVQRVLNLLQAQAAKVAQTASSPAFQVPFDHEREALNKSITALKRERNELETLYSIARVLNSTLEFDEVLRLVMDQVISVVNAERGFLMLVNPATNELEFTIARDKRMRTTDESAFKISRSTVNRVVSTRKPLLTDDAQIDAARSEERRVGK